MTKRSSVLARNFFRRDKVRALVPDLRLILAVATVSCETHCGAWLPGDLARDTGLEEAALLGGLADLEARGLILRDTDTGEIFLADFFRDNVFATPARRGQFRGDFARVESSRLREEIRKAALRSLGCGVEEKDFSPTEQTISNENSSLDPKEREEKESQVPSSAEEDPTPCGEKRRKNFCGITVWTPSDMAQAREIANRWPPADLAAVVGDLIARGNDPLPSRVLRELEAMAEAREVQRKIEAEGCDRR